MKKCSAKAFSMCPDRAGCLPGAVYMEGSDCEKFNEDADKRPMTNADRIRTMSDEELAKFLCNIILVTVVDGCSGCIADDYCHFEHNGMIDYLMEENNGTTGL